MKIINKILEIFKNINSIKLNLDQIKINQFALFDQFINNYSISEISNLNFKIFSQFNEDLIIQYLIKNITIKNKNFIELGVENYEESNTRLLLEKDNWNGLIVDSSKKHIDEISQKNFFWRHSLITEKEFITKENINHLLTKKGFFGKIGILSIDIDGNDLWVWDEISVVIPDIVIIEYNSKLGKDKSLTIKYEKNFTREKFGIDKLVYGASLKALIKISSKKGYSLVATNKNGNNAFFVKKELLTEKVKEINLEEGYKKSLFREYINSKNNIFLEESKINNYVMNHSKIVEI